MLLGTSWKIHWELGQPFGYLMETKKTKSPFPPPFPSKRKKRKNPGASQGHVALPHQLSIIYILHLFVTFFNRSLKQGHPIEGILFDWCNCIQTFGSTCHKGWRTSCLFFATSFSFGVGGQWIAIPPLPFPLIWNGWKIFFPLSNLHFLTTSEGKVIFFWQLSSTASSFTWVDNLFFGQTLSPLASVSMPKMKIQFFFFPLQASKPAFLFITFREQSILLVLPSNTYKLNKLNSFLCGHKFFILT